MLLIKLCKFYMQPQVVIVFKWKITFLFYNKVWHLGHVVADPVPLAEEKSVTKLKAPNASKFI